jgi:hypothetical protein
VPGKQKIFLLVALLFGLPALVTLGLLTSSTKAELADGTQPGGSVKGRVVRPGGAPGADIDVTASKLVGNSIHDVLVKTRTAADGGFELALPPLEGRYLLRFNGKALRESFVEYGWLGRDGKTVTPPPVDVEMGAGCRLEIQIVGTDKQPVSGGRYELSGKTSSGLFGGFSQGTVERSGTFEKGAFEIDGLPPVSVRLQVRLDSGERVDSVLELSEGVVAHKIEL